jgi:L-serine/L-threonine ammonia-lyase
MVMTILETEKVGKLVCSSGGNAGHAVATVGKKLGIPVDVFVPTTTKAMMVAKLRAKGASVIIHGDNWNAADKLAREAEAQQEDAHYIPPYDDPRIWEGHSTIIDELAEAGVEPDKIVLSVGGGGLLCGIQSGILRRGWATQILAAETTGTASFAKAFKAGTPEALTAITST